MKSNVIHFTSWKANKAWKPSPDCFFQMELTTGIKLGFIKLIDVQNENFSYQFTEKWQSMPKKKQEEIIGEKEHTYLADVRPKDKGRWQGGATICNCPCESCQIVAMIKNECLEVDEVEEELKAMGITDAGFEGTIEEREEAVSEAINRIKKKHRLQKKKKAKTQKKTKKKSR